MQQLLHDDVVKVQKMPSKQANNVSDIEGTKPKNRHQARQCTGGNSLNADDIPGTKASNKQYTYRRKQIRNPLDPIKETPVADYNAPILGGAPSCKTSRQTFDASKMSSIQKMGLGGNMRDSMDCS